MSIYIYDQPDWPRFRWDSVVLAQPMADVRLRQGRLLGQMETLGLFQRQEAELQARTEEVVTSSEIEGEVLKADAVRSSIARKLGVDVASVHPIDRRVEGVVEMTLEATRNYALPLSKKRLFDWHRSLFGETSELKVGRWRDDSKGPMRVVSGRQHVHFEAPAAERLEEEMKTFFEGVNRSGEVDPLLKAGLAHLWFVTIHPFEDGNGRIARAIADWALARSEGSARRFYSMSAQIRRERQDYYRSLENAQKGSLDITEWLRWFLGSLDKALRESEASLGVVLKKDRFWKGYGQSVGNERQRKVLNLLMDGSFEGKLTTSKWAKLTKCSQDTATRDIQNLMEKGVLTKEAAGGRSTSYSLNPEAFRDPA
jgi:Fic family protein